MRRTDIEGLLNPVAEIVNDAEFWSHTDAGLAIFLSSDDLRWFRLPASVDEALLVSDRFWLAPLVPFATAAEGFYVLALSENDVRLLRANRYRITQLELGEIPASMADALEFDDRESQLHSHGADRVGSGQVSATFHGHSAGTDFERVDRERFLQAVDRGLAARVGDSSDPLILAGVAELVAQFRNLTSYKSVAEPFVAGNPEHLSPRELHERTVPLIAAELEANHADLGELFGSPATATVDSIQDTIDAAASGRVATLFVAAGQHAWGSVNADSRKVELHQDRQPGDDDVVDLATRETLAHGGDVVAVDQSEMPTGGTLAAVLRY
jgi:hypothetical protein